MARGPSVALLTGGSDKPYALGLVSALAHADVKVEFIGSDELDCPDVRTLPHVRFLNLRGDQRESAALGTKVVRILTYYLRLLRYAARAEPPILHILWNNKVEIVDRTVLMAYYRATGKRVVLTAHNVNAAARDGKDSWLNRWSLRTQYRLCDHVFVHTSAMKRQLASEFSIPSERVTVIPFGINDTIPRRGIGPAAARQRLGIPDGERTLLFFGQIAPYKGIEYLMAAMAALAEERERIRLIVAGKVKRGHEAYWDGVQRSVRHFGISDRVLQKIQFIPDEEVEPYFDAADAVVLPYVDVFQSGVPFLAFSFGVPVIATDVGSLREDVTAETGVLCRPRDADDLARAIRAFFRSGLHTDRLETRRRIRQFAEAHHSWGTVVDLTRAVYDRLAAARPRAAAGPGTSAIHATAASNPECPE